MPRPTFLNVEPLRVRRAGRSDERPIASRLNLAPAHVHRIEQSHERCVALGVSRIERPDHSPIGRADLNVARERNLRLHQHAAPVMEMLYGQIVDTESLVLLTDATGTILHSIGDADFLGRAAEVALSPGVNWSESTKGTNAVGTALVEETPTLVHADEHYQHANHFLTCSAAPILDPRGNVLGVLDVSGDQRSYHQHTMALVKMSARMIENHWLTDDYRHVMRVHFHQRAECIGTLMEGILAIDPDGRIVGANRGALEHLGLSGAALRQHTLTSLWGVGIGALVERFRTALATPLSVHLRDGRSMHLHARFNWPVWTSLSEAMERAAALAQPAAAAPPVAPSAALGCDAQVEAARDKLVRVFARGIPVLLHGERGTGKLGLAREVHRDSPRGDGPFVVLRCEGASPAKLAAELFGRLDDGSDTAPPAPSGAAATPSALARARGGSLLLENIDHLPPPLQARLARCIAEGLPDPQGQRRPLDLGWMASSRRPLREAVDAGAFHPGLFDALNGLAVGLPPLRERSDLLPLVDRLLADLVREEKLPPLQIEPRLRPLLAAYDWPGNLRQLRSVLRSAAVLAEDEGLITALHLPDELNPAAPAAASAHAGAGPADTQAPATPAGSLQAQELLAIQEAVAQAEGNISVAARRLGISRNTIYRKLRWTDGTS